MTVVLGLAGAVSSATSFAVVAIFRRATSLQEQRNDSSNVVGIRDEVSTYIWATYVPGHHDGDGDPSSYRHYS